MSRRKTAHLVSLGCPKNLVDSEVMLGVLRRDGYTIVASPREASVIVVNTCGFINPAKEESIDAIMEAISYKQEDPDKVIVVAGCLSQRYAPELRRELSEVDHFLGTHNFATIAEVLRAPGRARLPSRAVPLGFALRHDTPRVSTSPPGMSYVKISEGCSNACAFCAIPLIRGPQRSRPIDDVVAEVDELLARGVVEINLIAQDLCAYGKDLAGGHSLAKLLRALDKLGARDTSYWVRCLYTYPRGLTREVIEVIAGAAHVLPYLDIPLQHIADHILLKMKRGKGGRATAELIRRLRASIPKLTLRTAFITGLPGETEDDFEELLAFVRELRFERLGVFVYSPEQDTPAASMPHQVPKELAKERRDRLMELQREISREQQQALIGETLEVLVQGVSEETELLLEGRHRGQAHEIDGVTYITAGTASPGQLVHVLIEEASDYDLAGPMVNQELL